MHLCAQGSVPVICAHKASYLYLSLRTSVYIREGHDIMHIRRAHLYLLWAQKGLILIPSLHRISTDYLLHSNCNANYSRAYEAQN